MASMTVLNKVYNVFCALRSDVLICCICISLHILLNHVWPRFKKRSKSFKHWGKSQPCTANEVIDPPPAQPARSNRPPQNNRQGQSQRGAQIPRDESNRGQAGHYNDAAKMDWVILDEWSTLKWNSHVPVLQLVQVVGAMRRLNQASHAVADEICGYLHRNKRTCSISLINELLDILAKSMDTELVEGIVHFMPQLDIEHDGKTYDILIQMNYMVRNFEQVGQFASEMQSKGIVLTSSSCLVLLKTALHNRRLDEAIRYYAELFGEKSEAMTASAAPTLVATQLVELAWSEGRVPTVFDAIDCGKLPRTPELQSALNRKISRPSTFKRNEPRGAGQDFREEDKNPINNNKNDYYEQPRQPEAYSEECKPAVVAPRYRRQREPDAVFNFCGMWQGTKGEMYKIEDQGDMNLTCVRMNAHGMQHFTIEYYDGVYWWGGNNKYYFDINDSYADPDQVHWYENNDWQKQWPSFSWRRCDKQADSNDVQFPKRFEQEAATETAAAPTKPTAFKWVPKSASAA